ncbi:MAG TPA: hypothetical protein VL026_01775 [Rhizomicrobium sp.]|nr:hypothetical protein [Rhizomicrobium sp.]
MIIRIAIFLGSFAIVWFLALFCLLPVGQPDDPDGEPTMKLTTKFVWATVLAVVGFGVFYTLIRLGVLDI